MTENLFGNTDSAGAPGGWYTAHCDGGSRGNPGPAGYGAVVEDPEGRTVAKLSHFLGMVTNNVAEYSGLLAVLNWARENGARRLRVISDSELMVKQMQGKYKVASPGLRPLWEQARQLSRQLEDFEIRHTLRGGNKVADQLANEAMDEGMKKIREARSRDQGAGGSAPAPAGSGHQTAGGGQAPMSRPAVSSASPKAPRQVLEGFVKGGVIHLLSGELPEGVFVTIIRK